MTIPPGLRDAPQRLVDFVRELMPGIGKRVSAASALDIELGVHLRGNERLVKALGDLLRSRIEGRAFLPEPTDPLTCAAMLARDKECYFLIRKIDSLLHSAPPAGDDGEPPA